MIDPSVLGTVAWLASQPAEVRASLARAARERTLVAGETLFSAGDPTPGIVLVTEGCIRVVRDVGGRRHVVHVERAGGTLGEVPTFDSSPLPASAIASEPSRCVVIPTAHVVATVAAHPSLGLALLTRMASRVRLLVARLDGLAARSVRQRLASHLIVRAAIRPGRPFTLGMTQEQLAEELGTVREVVVRELLALRRDNVLRALGGGKFAAVDLPALGEIAGRDGTSLTRR